MQAGLNENLKRVIEIFDESEIILRYLACEGEINVLPTAMNKISLRAAGALFSWAGPENG